MKKMIKLLVLTMLLTSMFCCTAFASSGEEKVSLLTENVASGVVYGEQQVKRKCRSDGGLACS